MLKYIHNIFNNEKKFNELERDLFLTSTAFVNNFHDELSASIPIYRHEVLTHRVYTLSEEYTSEVLKRKKQCEKKLLKYAECFKTAILPPFVVFPYYSRNDRHWFDEKPSSYEKLWYEIAVDLINTTELDSIFRYFENYNYPKWWLTNHDEILDSVSNRPVYETFPWKNKNDIDFIMHKTNGSLEV